MKMSHLVFNHWGGPRSPQCWWRFRSLLLTYKAPAGSAPLAGTFSLVCQSRRDHLHLLLDKKGLKCKYVWDFKSPETSSESSLTANTLWRRWNENVWNRLIYQVLSCFTQSKYSKYFNWSNIGKVRCPKLHDRCFCSPVLLQGQYLSF